MKIKVYYDFWRWWSFEYREPSVYDNSKEKHIHPENYDWQTYEVKQNDTLYSVLNYLWKENWIPAELVTQAIASTNSKIKPWDKISFELQDSNSAELTINNKTYIIYNDGRVIETSNDVDKFKLDFNNLQKEILETLWNNQEIIKKLNEILSWEKDMNANELVKYQDKLYKSNDRLQHIVWLVLEVKIREYENPHELIDDINTILNSNLSVLTKHLFVKYLKKHDFNLKWSDSIKVFNHILNKYPKYKKIIENYIQYTVDPTDGEIAATNLF